MKAALIKAALIKAALIKAAIPCVSLQRALAVDPSVLAYLCIHALTLVERIVILVR